MKIFITIFICCMLVISLQAQQGTLDKTFGANGIVLTSNGYYWQGYSSAVQPDDKIVVGGLAGGDGNGVNFLLIRYLPDGSIDSSFGNNGTVITFYKQFFDNSGWTAVCVQPDGKIVATGYAYDFTSYNIDIVLERCNADGSLDSTFGEDGKVVTDLGKDERANAMTLQGDGKIIVTGKQTYSNSISNVLTLRYNSDGTLDKSFNHTGYIVYPTSINEGFAVAVQPDNKIVVGGEYGNPKRFFLLRYLSDGSKDEGFGNGGQVITTIGEGSLTTQINSLLLQSDGSIVAGGIIDEGIDAGQNMAAVKYKGNGGIDSLFGIDGKAIVRFKSGNSVVFTLLPNSDGRIVLAGGANGASLNQSDFAIAQLLPDGRVDSSFGTNGTTVTDLGYIDQCYSAIMQKSGKVVLAGLSFDVQNPYFRTFSLARYNVSNQG